MDISDTTGITLPKTLPLRVGMYALAFLIPALFSAPQWATGTVINALLFSATFHMSKKELVPVYVLPSLGAVTHGVLFGPQTVFLYYFLPFIWASNYVLVNVFCMIKTKNFPLRVSLSALCKFALLAVAAQVYFRGGIVPVMFVTSMGAIQFITALAGGVLAYGYVHYIRWYERSKYSH